MKKIIYLFTGILFLTVSCTSVKKTIPTAGLQIQVNLDMNDLEYMGEVTGTATQRYVLGIPFGGRKNYAGILQTSQTFFLNLLNDRAKNNAIYDALLSKPDADFVLPLTVEEKTNQEFLGKTKTITVKGKAFRIKTKDK